MLEERSERGARVARSPTTSGGRAGRFPALDGLRGLGAVLVVAAHAAIRSHADSQSWIAPLVDRFTVSLAIFFALSGFLIYRPFVVARESGRRRPSFLSYARHRVARIVPAYWVALTLMIVIPGIVAVAPELGLVKTGHWWVFYGFAQTYDLRFAVQGIGQAWTLCVEAAFYLVLPLLVLGFNGLARRGFGIRSEIAIVLGLGALSALLRIVTYADPGFLVEPLVFSVTIGGTFLWLACGMVLATWNVAGRADGVLARALGSARGCWTAALLVLLGTSVSGVFPHHVGLPQSVAAWALEHVLNAVIAFLLLAPAVAPGRGEPGPLLRLMGSRPAVFIGTVSYGIYLWHVVVLDWLIDHGALTWVRGLPYVTLLVVGFAISTGLGTASYFLIELPARRLAHGARRHRREVLAIGT